MKGGRAGGAARCTVNPDTPGARELTSKATNVVLRAGDLVRFDSQGGGAYGAPAERDGRLISRDLTLDKVSAAAAREEYGAVR